MPICVQMLLFCAQIPLTKNNKKRKSPGLCIIGMNLYAKISNWTIQDWLAGGTIGLPDISIWY